MLFKKFSISEFGSVLIQFALSQLVSKGLNMISGFLVISMLNPEELGLYNGVGIFLGYILLSHGGIINGLGRELPYQMGKGNLSEARRLASSVAFLTTVLSCIGAVVFFGLALHSYVSGLYLASGVYISYTIVGFFYLFNNQYLQVLYRSNKDFGSLSKQNIKLGLVNIVSVILVYKFGFIGLILRGLFLSSFQFFLLFKYKPIELKWEYSIGDFKLLLKTGFPIFSVGYVNTLWITIMNNLLFITGGPLLFGLYSLSTVVQGAIGVIPSAFSNVIYPRMTTMLAEGKDTREIISSNLKSFVFQFVFLSVVAVSLASILPFLVTIFLPKYESGIIAAQWMCFVPVVQSFDSISNIYNVIKRQKWLIVSLVSGATVGLCYILVNIYFRNFELALFPQGLLLGMGIQQLMSYIFIKKIF